MTIQRSKRIGGFLEHLLCHGNRVAQLFKIEGGNSFRRWQGYDLVIDQSEEVLDGLQLSLNELYRTLNVLESRHPSPQNFHVGLLNALLTIVPGMLYRAFSLRQLVLHRLPVDRTKVMFASPVNVEQIDKIFPTLIQALQVVGNLFGTGKLLVVRIDLVLHPPQVLNRLALAGIESFDLRFALLFAQLMQPLLFATINQASIE